MGKTNAEHCKNYYNRKKAAKEAEKIRQGLSVEKPIKKTGAERTRAYRLRKKMLSQANESSVTNISSIPSTSNSRIRTFEPSFQLVTTSASTNRPDVSTVSSTGIADHDGDNLHDSFLSTSTYDNRNSITVQAEIQSERLRSPEYVNYYDSNTDLLTQLKKELSVEENLETSCSFGSDLFFEDDKILEVKNITTNESKNNNTDERLTLNGIIKHEKEYHDIIKTEKLEEREESDNTYCVTVKTEELESQEELDDRYCVTVKTEELESQEELDNRYCVTVKTEELKSQEELDNRYCITVKTEELKSQEELDNRYCVTVKTEELESQEELGNRYCVTVKTEELESQEELDNKGYVTINTQKLADQEGLDNVRSSSVHYSVLVTPKRVQCKWCGRPFENSNTEQIDTVPENNRTCITCQNSFQLFAPIRQSATNYVNTSTERVRKYRDRQKLLKASESSVDNQQSVRKLAKTSTERTREYRERQKLLEASESFVQNQQSVTTKRTNTAAQRAREYRERKKLLRASESFVENEQSITNKIKTSAKRVKECRERKKLLKTSDPFIGNQQRTEQVKTLELDV